MGRPRGVDKTAVIVRLPDILLARLKSQIKREDTGLSDFVEAAVRARLDCGMIGHTHTEVHDNVKAASLLERFAGLGVTTAAQLEAQEPAANGTVIQVGNCPTEDVPRRNWVKFYAEMGEMEPAEAEYAFSQATAEVKLPSGFRRQPPAKQVQWLQVNA